MFKISFSFCRLITEVIRKFPQYFTAKVRSRVTDSVIFFSRGVVSRDPYNVSLVTVWLHYYVKSNFQNDTWSKVFFRFKTTVKIKCDVNNMSYVLRTDTYQITSGFSSATAYECLTVCTQYFLYT